MTEAERVEVCRQAVGKPEAEARQIIRLRDGNVYQHEFDAVMLRLHSSSRAFNEGVSDRIRSPEFRNRYSAGIEYSNHVHYDTGWNACDLAIELHGLEAVKATL